MHSYSCAVCFAFSLLIAFRWPDVPIVTNDSVLDHLRLQVGVFLRHSPTFLTASLFVVVIILLSLVWFRLALFVISKKFYSTNSSRKKMYACV
jgi:hypothetical protein